jgi:hypothetical protein
MERLLRVRNARVKEALFGHLKTRAAKRIAVALQAARARSCHHLDVSPASAKRLAAIRVAR